MATGKREEVPASGKQVRHTALRTLATISPTWRKNTDLDLSSCLRYQYHPPKFQRGPLHPIQSPPSSDPIARDFLPGPFYFPRLKETWQSTIAPDLMTLTYVHKPPGQQARERIGQRLRSWDGSSPYHKNRPLRGPRGGTTLRPVELDITFKNVPEILAITISTYQPQAIKTPTYMLAARSAVQAVTGAKPEIIRIKKGVSQWHIAKGNLAGAKATVYGDQAYELLDKMIHLVFPRLKDWQGVNAGSGDDTGNIGFGFTPDQFALFPEIQFNYDAYPPKVSWFVSGAPARGSGTNDLTCSRFREPMLRSRRPQSRTGMLDYCFRPWVSRSRAASSTKATHRSCDVSRSAPVFRGSSGRGVAANTWRNSGAVLHYKASLHRQKRRYLLWRKCISFGRTCATFVLVALFI